MASRAVPPLRRRSTRHLLALAVLALLQLVLLPAAAASSSIRPLPVALATTATTERPNVAAAGVGEEREDDGLVGRQCWYTVEVKTSCASRARSSSDAVSLSFGDAYRDEVYVARLSPEYGFERCAKDTFKVGGPCGYGVCYLYLRRAGRDGWTPEWVRVYEPTSPTPSTFYYGDPLPAGVWYGFNRCPHRASADASASSGGAAQAL